MPQAPEDNAPITLTIDEVAFVNGLRPREYMAKLPFRDDRISQPTLSTP